MSLIIETDNLGEYLEETEIIDYRSPNILQLTKAFSEEHRDEVSLVQWVYEYVRDQIAHSWDILAMERTCNASEVLTKGHGNCCGKSHLLAAILRSLGIPTGFCYQWLVSDDDPKLLVLHGLNAVYLKPIKRWIRLDARGNKPSVQAEFSIAEERLAWPVRADFGEEDLMGVLISPKKEVVNALKSNKDRNKSKDYWVYKMNPMIGSVDKNGQETKG